MTLAAFLRERKEEIVASWADKVRDRLGLTTEDRPQLIDDLPEFLDRIADRAGLAVEDWGPFHSAREHGEQRLALGIDLASLVREFGLVSETVLELADRYDHRLDAEDHLTLVHLITEGTAVSAEQYRALRDRQLAEEHTRHFSFVAHELRTPLGVAHLAATLLIEAAGEDSPAAARLRQAHDKLRELIDNQLVQARIEGRPVLAIEREEAGELVEAACDDVAEAAVHKGQEVVREVVPFTLRVDRKLVVSALTNLLSNAVKYSRRDARIVVRARAEGERARFEVEDACGGLREGLAADLFEPHVQSGDDRSGFGLGLAIVERAVGAHGGAVWVDDLPPVGCRFVVELPLAPEVG